MLALLTSFTSALGLGGSVVAGNALPVIGNTTKLQVSTPEQNITEQVNITSAMLEEAIKKYSAEDKMVVEKESRSGKTKTLSKRHVEQEMKATYKLTSQFVSTVENLIEYLDDLLKEPTSHLKPEKKEELRNLIEEVDGFDKIAHSNCSPPVKEGRKKINKLIKCEKLEHKPGSPYTELDPNDLKESLHKFQNGEEGVKKIDSNEYIHKEVQSVLENITSSLHSNSKEKLLDAIASGAETLKKIRGKMPNRNFVCNALIDYQYTGESSHRIYNALKCEGPLVTIINKGQVLVKNLYKLQKILAKVYGSQSGHFTNKQKLLVRASIDKLNQSYRDIHTGCSSHIKQIGGNLQLLRECNNGLQYKEGSMNSSITPDDAFEKLNLEFLELELREGLNHQSAHQSIQHITSGLTAALKNAQQLISNNAYAWIIRLSESVNSVNTWISSCNSFQEIKDNENHTMNDLECKAHPNSELSELKLSPYSNDNRQEHLARTG